MTEQIVIYYSYRSKGGKPAKRERHASECGTNGRSFISDLVDDQLGLVFGSLTIPED